MKKPLRKYNVDVFFVAHYTYGGTDEIVSGMAPELDYIESYETMAVSKKQAENNARFHFRENDGFKGWSPDLFVFAAHELPMFEMCNHVKTGIALNRHLVNYCEVENACKINCNCESCKQYEPRPEVQP